MFLLEWLKPKHLLYSAYRPQSSSTEHEMSEAERNIGQTLSAWGGSGHANSAQSRTHFTIAMFQAPSSPNPTLQAIRCMTKQYNCCQPLGNPTGIKKHVLGYRSCRYHFSPRLYSANLRFYDIWSMGGCSYTKCRVSRKFIYLRILLRCFLYPYIYENRHMKNPTHLKMAMLAEICSERQ
jgi:hypothetical protein